jgi:signal transduction histidine kinase
MIKEMLESGRPLEITLSEQNLNDLAEETTEVARPIAEKAGVLLKTELDKFLPALKLDVLRFKQALMNLIVNAIQASPPGEKIFVKTRRARLEVFVEIADCGCGVPGEDRDKVFQPVFTTKKEGTGLGLPIVRKIVEAHGRRITCFAVQT